MIWFRLHLFGRKIKDVMLFSLHITRWHNFDRPATGDVPAGHLIKVVFSRPIHCKHALSPAVTDKYLCGGTLKQGKYPILLQISNVFFHLFIYVGICDNFTAKIPHRYGLLWCSIIPDLASENPLKLVSLVFECSHHSLSTFLLYDTMRYFRLILYFHCLSLGTDHSSKDFWFFFMGNGT